MAGEEFRKKMNDAKTDEEWCEAAQYGIGRKEFETGLSVKKLHEIKAALLKMAQGRQLQPTQTMAKSTPFGVVNEKKKEKSYAEASLKELMDMVRMQQEQK
jgi:hypothetical protein